MQDNISKILIPDVHGREFWKEAIPYIEQGYKTIFLGDYLDVYPHEGISPAHAVENFEQILGFADYDNVQLLLGNHDSGYILSQEICDCRTDYRNFAKIHDLFEENLDKFKLCVYEDKYLISHAGIHTSWFSKHFGSSQIDSIDQICDSINHTLLDPFISDDSSIGSRSKAVDILADVSYMRGGYSEAGSIIWADIYEFSPMRGYNILFANQIVGHTMQYDTKKPLVFTNDNRQIICIDCSAVFYIDTSGKIRWLKDGQAI